MSVNLRPPSSELALQSYFWVLLVTPIPSQCPSTDAAACHTPSQWRRQYAVGKLLCAVAAAAATRRLRSAGGDGAPQRLLAHEFELPVRRAEDHQAGPGQAAHECRVLVRAFEPHVSIRRCGIGMDAGSAAHMQRSERGAMPCIPPAPPALCFTPPTRLLPLFAPLPSLSPHPSPRRHAHTRVATGCTSSVAQHTSRIRSSNG